MLPRHEKRTQAVSRDCDRASNKAGAQLHLSIPDEALQAAVFAQ